MKTLPLKELYGLLHTLNANRVTVDGEGYPPGNLFFTSFRWEKCYRGVDDVYFKVLAECRRMGPHLLPGLYDLAMWPEWLPLAMERSGCEATEKS